MLQNKPKKVILTAILVVLISAVSVSFAEGQETVIKIDKNTINRGYTIPHNDDDLRFAVTPGQVDQEVEVTVKNRSLEGNSLPSQKKLVSNIYSFDMLGKDYNPLVTGRPSWIALHYNTADYSRKSIYYWNGIKNDWIKLPSSTDTQGKYVRATTHLPYSRVAVLEDVPEVTMHGGASWYDAPTRQSAAMRVFNKGDMVRVTNLANGKSIEVVVADRGPYINGRIIDLSTDAFAQIAPLSQGVTQVKVEKF
ncbi:MAG: septal ring lytic transglycosylase RlpA family protein [Parcubacteria group bacterium]